MKKSKDVATPIVQQDFMQEIGSTGAERNAVEESQSDREGKAPKKISPAFDDMGEPEQKKLRRKKGDAPRE